MVVAVSFNLTRPDRFPVGTSVGAYPVSNWPTGRVDTSAAPIGSATESQTTDSNGTAAFVALSAGDYVAYASVGGDKRYVFFTAGEDSQVAKERANLGGVLTQTSGTHASRLNAAHSANTLYKETDTGLVYLDDGSSWNIWKGDGNVRKTADETVNNSTTPQDDDHLKFPIEPNESWFVQAFLQCTGSSANADWKFGWTGPTGATAQWNRVANDSFTTVATTGTPALLVSISTTTVGGGGSGNIAITLAGWFTADSIHSGNIQLQWAQSTQTAENNTIKAGSFLHIRRMT